MRLQSKKEKEEGDDQHEGKPDKEEDLTDGSTIHSQSNTQQEERAELKDSTREEDEEMKNGSPEGGEDKTASETKAEEEKEDLERRDDATEKATNPNSEEEERMTSEVILQASISPSVFVNAEMLKHTFPGSKRTFHSPFPPTGGHQLAVGGGPGGKTAP